MNRMYAFTIVLALVLGCASRAEAGIPADANFDGQVNVLAPAVAEHCGGRTDGLRREAGDSTTKNT